jgi:hypothetical protein
MPWTILASTADEAGFPKKGHGAFRVRNACPAGERQLRAAQEWAPLPHAERRLARR